MELKPVILAMALYLSLSYIIPKVITKPTGVQTIDDLVIFIISQQGSLVPGSILVAIITLITFHLV